MPQANIILLNISEKKQALREINSEILLMSHARHAPQHMANDSTRSRRKHRQRLRRQFEPPTGWRDAA